MRRLSTLLYLLLAGVAVAAPPAGPDRSKPPEGGPPPKIELPKPTRWKLPSGTQVLVVERHTLPIVAIQVVWPTGSVEEKAGQFGLASLVADLLAEGTPTRPSLQLAEELEGLGARFDTGSSWDHTHVALTTLTRHLDRSLAVLADVLANPAFADKELERLRAEHLTGLVQQRDVAGVVAGIVAGAAIYGRDHRFGRASGGTEEDLRHLTRADVVRFHEEHLRPDTATLIVVGDVTPAKLRPVLEKALAGWKNPASPAAPPQRLAAPTAARRLVLVDRPGAPQSELRIGHHGVPRSSPDYFPLVVMNTIFGGQFSSRLNMNLREKNGYTYGVRSDLGLRRDGGPFLIGAPVKTANTAAAIGEALRELDQMRALPVTPAELRLARDLLERGMARRFSTASAVASELAAIAIYGLPDDYLSTYAARIEAVTLDEVQRVARRYLDPTKLAVVIVGDRKLVAPTLVAPLQLPVPELQDADARVVPESAAPRPLPAKTTPTKAPTR